jgi:hypothetical protein
MLDSSSTRVEYTTLEQMKDKILAASDWHSQNGPNDYAGYRWDVETRQDIERARTWEQLTNIAPTEWQDRIADTHHR